MRVPVAQVADNITDVPLQIEVVFTETLVGSWGNAVTVIGLVATRLLSMALSRHET